MTPVISKPLQRVPACLHIGIDVVLCASAATVAAAASRAGAPTAITTILRGQPLSGIPLVLASVVCAWLVFHALTTLPRTQAAGKLVAHVGS